MSITELIERGPDGFVVIDCEGVILRANNAFLELAQVGTEASVVEQRLGRWLGQPGADLKTLIDNVRQHGMVRLFPSTLHGELGIDSEVEISATGNTGLDPKYIGVLIQDVGGRLPGYRVDNNREHTLASLDTKIGKTPLRRLVKDTTRMVERH